MAHLYGEYYASLRHRPKLTVEQTENGRISVAGLNPNNMDYFIDAVDDVVRACP